MLSTSENLFRNRAEKVQNSFNPAENEWNGK